MAQRRVSECGVACLAMVARAYGRPVSIRSTRTLFESADLVSVADLTSAAAKVGLRASAYRAKSLSACRRLKLPVVLHLDGGHYVVLARLANRKAEAVDPGVGRMRVGPEMLKRFSGVAIAFEPVALATAPRSGRWRSGSMTS